MPSSAALNPQSQGSPTELKPPHQPLTESTLPAFRKRAVYFERESPSHPPGAKDHVSGILDSSAGRNSGEVVAENWNSVPHGRWSLQDRRACEMSVQRLISVVRHSQQASRVYAAIEGPRRIFEMRTEAKIDTMRVNSRSPRPFAAKLYLRSLPVRALVPFLC